MKREILSQGLLTNEPKMFIFNDKDIENFKYYVPFVNLERCFYLRKYQTMLFECRNDKEEVYFHHASISENELKHCTSFDDMFFAVTQSEWKKLLGGSCD